MALLRLILGDQLNPNHGWFQTVSPDVTYVLMEIRSETDYVRHHAQKVIAIFAAMRAFARTLRQAGHDVRYLKIGDPDNLHDFDANLRRLLDTGGFDRFEYQAPDEYRVDRHLFNFRQSLEIPSAMVDSEHFLTERDELASFFKGKKTYLMESFYRMMRRKHRILLTSEGEPVGGQWNFDVENREPWRGTPPIPDPVTLRRDHSEIWDEIQAAGVRTLGTPGADRFEWPLDREDALRLLDHFVSRLLPYFGTYQDAMTVDSRTLFHSRLSFALNVKMLHPREVIDAAVAGHFADPTRIGLAQVEGFVRQILGWREYMRGVYWARMPEYGRLNELSHDRPLPAWYWTGETKMKCLREAVTQSLETAYAHHIQRLMVTGNFALLAGCHPDDVDRWYLGIYIDAFEWVEITNTRGMSQFADGGIVGSKPYCSSAAYMNRMSDYCAGCHYSPKARHGERACPFNSLYWHFHVRHAATLRRNQRLAYTYKNWDRFGPEEQTAIMNQAERYLSDLDSL